MQCRRLRTIVGAVGVIAAIVVYVWFTVRYASGINTGIHPTLWLAFIAGLLSFVSPCCLNRSMKGRNTPRTKTP